MNVVGRLHFNCTQTPLAGWSETYFFEEPSYSAAETSLNALNSARLGLLSSDCYLAGSLISDTDVKGDSYPTGLVVPTPGSWAAAATDPTGNLGLAYRVKFYAGSLKRGTRFIHGIPKSQIAAGGFQSFTAPFLTALNNYLLLVETSSNLGSRIKGAVAPPFYSLSPYSGYQSYGLEKRNIGRPFGLQRGRALIA